MKSIYLLISIAIMFLIHGSIAQLISTTDTPYQGSFQAGITQGSTPSTMTPYQGSFQAGFDLRSTPSTMTPYQGSFEVGTNQKSTSTIQTPSQMTFAGGNNESTQIMPPVQASGNVPAQMYNISIANALKEGDALHVLVANNGTTAMDLANWRLVTDNRNLTFTFPIFTLMPRAMVTIHTHEGNNTASDLHGSNFMWNGTREIKLLDNNGMLVYDYRIGT
ncbi:MAG: lamin tail domain-containing protein [Methanotrichaceae archaeon]|nr:lamin tail domain-containing protein [Methanotrichaceae archaeon]